MQNLRKYIAQRRPLLEERIRLAIQDLERNNHHIIEKEMLDALSGMICKGKLLRGLFVCLAYEMYANKQCDKDANVLDIAAAVEFNHTGLLIHDDFIDRDDLRRDIKTIHKQYEEKANASDPAHYGASMSVVVGDTCLYIAHKLLSRASYNRQSLPSLFFKEIYLTCLGQLIDITYAEVEEEPELQDIQLMHRLKTGRYTFSLPFKLGAMYAGTNINDVKIFDGLGETMGLVFQLRDDELGLFGDPDKTGKPVGSDVSSNRKTVLRYELFKRANKKDLVKLQTIFGKKKLSKADVVHVRDMVKKYKVVEAIRKEMRVLSDKALEEIERLSIAPEHAEILKELVEYNLTREK